MYTKNARKSHTPMLAKVMGGKGGERKEEEGERR
jgi:hypothetical protein